MQRIILVVLAVVAAANAGAVVAPVSYAAPYAYTAPAVAHYAAPAIAKAVVPAATSYAYHHRAPPAKVAVAAAPVAVAHAPVVAHAAPLVAHAAPVAYHAPGYATAYHY